MRVRGCACICACVLAWVCACLGVCLPAVSVCVACTGPICIRENTEDGFVQKYTKTSPSFVDFYSIFHFSNSSVLSPLTLSLSLSLSHTHTHTHTHRHTLTLSFLFFDCKQDFLRTSQKRRAIKLIQMSSILVCAANCENQSWLVRCRQVQ